MVRMDLVPVGKRSEFPSHWLSDRLSNASMHKLEALDLYYLLSWNKTKVLQSVSPVGSRDTYLIELL